MILDKFLWKYEGGEGVILTHPSSPFPPEKTILKKPSFISVKYAVCIDTLPPQILENIGA